MDKIKARSAPRGSRWSLGRSDYVFGVLLRFDPKHFVDVRLDLCLGRRVLRGPGRLLRLEGELVAVLQPLFGFRAQLELAMSAGQINRFPRLSRLPPNLSMELAGPWLIPFYHETVATCRRGLLAGS